MQFVGYTNRRFCENTFGKPTGGIGEEYPRRGETRSLAAAVYGVVVISAQILRPNEEGQDLHWELSLHDSRPPLSLVAIARRI
jgi:hypothetical protein